MNEGSSRIETSCRLLSAIAFFPRSGAAVSIVRQIGRNYRPSIFGFDRLVMRIDSLGGGLTNIECFMDSFQPMSFVEVLCSNRHQVVNISQITSLLRGERNG